MKMKFVHVNIVAKDWRELADFYIRVFGCKAKPPERDLSGPWLDELTDLTNTRIRGIHLLLPGYSSDGPTIEIFEYKEEISGCKKAANTEGFAHIAFSVENVDAALNLITANGGSAVGETVDTEVENVGSINLVYARDPEGNIIELQRWK